MENLNWYSKSNLEMLEKMEFETVSDKNEAIQPEIVLRLTSQSEVLPPKPTDTENEVFQSEIERKIKKLFEEFDMMSVHEYDLTRVKKVKQLFKKYQTDNQKEQVIDDVHTLEI